MTLSSAVSPGGGLRAAVLRNLGPALVALALAAVAGLLSALVIAPVLGRLAAETGGAAVYDVERMVLLHATLPRMATALLCGAGLGLSGALFQQLLRNPLASPTTLGISAGAHLSLAVALLWMPDLLGIGRDLVALAGSAIAAGLVFLIGARRGFSPFALVLAGLVIGLWCGAFSAVLVMLNDRWLASLFIWGAGSLSVQSWAVPLSLAPKLAACALVAALIARPLGLIELGEAGAGALGLDTARLRVIGLAAAVALAAFITSAVGVIGFIGLVAPTIARLSGARRAGALMGWSALIGALLLWLTDGALQLVAGALADFLPTGAVTAIFGSPLLLLLLPRLKSRHSVPAAAGRASYRLALGGRRGPALAAAGVLLLLAATAGALFYGPGLDGRFTLLDAAALGEILPLRLPRVLAALACGALLAVSGCILQRLTGNEMASPEVLGISAGATFGVAIALFFAAAPGFGLQMAAAAVGAFAVLGIIVAFALRSGIAPERVLLAGIALSAMVDALVGVLSAGGDPRAMFLMRWMSGSTYAVDGPTAAGVSAMAGVLVGAALALHRWLDVIPLGPSAAAAVGLSVARSRLALFALAGLAAASATLCVGPLSFVGLMAPHLAREAGLTRAASQLCGAALIGAVLMMGADWIGRGIAYPYEIPGGLVSALIGAPFLIVLMRRRAG